MLNFVFDTREALFEEQFDAAFIAPKYSSHWNKNRLFPQNYLVHRKNQNQLVPSEVLLCFVFVVYSIWDVVLFWIFLSFQFKGGRHIHSPQNRWKWSTPPLWMFLTSSLRLIIYFKFLKSDGPYCFIYISASLCFTEMGLGFKHA